jgi:hypothetical protein
MMTRQSTRHQSEEEEGENEIRFHPRPRRERYQEQQIKRHAETTHPL